MTTDITRKAFQAAVTLAHIGVGNSIDNKLDDYMASVPKDPKHDGVNYFYVYESSHCVPNEDTPDPNDTTNGKVLGVNQFENTPRSELIRETECGGCNNINNSDWNRYFCDQYTGC